MISQHKIINDPVYGFISVPSPLVFQLIEHPYFQRLRRIKQLGLTHYVYPGGIHTRFHHALGAMHLMQESLAVLMRKQVEITEEEAESSLIAILLHDIGHGPYSHALEGVLLQMDHEALTLLFMEELNREFGGKLTMAIEIFTGSYSKPFLHQLVSSQLDLDRMDYLKRDSFFTGVAEGVIGHDRIIKMLNVHDNNIVVEEKALYSIEKFLVARRLMYLQVYLHKTVLSAEHMLKKLLLRARKLLVEASFPGMPEVLEDFLRSHPGAADIQRDPDLYLQRFADLDDLDLGYAVKVLSRQDDPVLKILGQGLTQRKLFRTVLRESAFTEAELQEARNEVSQMSGYDSNLARELVFTGMERTSSYNPHEQVINILMKSGEIKPITSALDVDPGRYSTDKHFLCGPKQGLHTI